MLGSRHSESVRSWAVVILAQFALLPSSDYWRSCVYWLWHRVYTYACVSRYGRICRRLNEVNRCPLRRKGRASEGLGCRAADVLGTQLVGPIDEDSHLFVQPRDTTSAYHWMKNYTNDTSSSVPTSAVLTLFSEHVAVHRSGRFMDEWCTILWVIWSSVSGTVNCAYGSSTILVGSRSLRWQPTLFDLFISSISLNIPY